MSILTNLFSIIGALPPPVAVLGDFNIHHSSWGCYQNDSLSSAFLDLVDDHNLCILNDGSPTRRVLPGQNPKSAVDLSLCTPATSSRLTWLTLCNTHGSDHFPILMSFPDSSNYILPPRNPRLKFNLSKADWTLFSQSVDALLVHLSPVPHENTHAAYSIFRNALLSAAETAIPTKNASRGKIPSLPWWDSDCSDLCKQRKEAEMEYALHMSPAKYISYKEVAARTVRTLSERKRLGWNMFCESLSPSSRPSLVWNNVRRFRGSVSVDHNSSSNDPSVWIDSFSCRLAPPYVPTLAESSSLPPPHSPTPDTLVAPFSLDELTAVLESLKDSSPGIDGIPYSFIVKCSFTSKLIFLNILNNIYSLGIPPDEWKTQIIVPILKPAKPNNESSSYRPIALSCTMSKILEHLVKNRLEWFVESRGILPASQFGFRKGLSTMDSVGCLATDIRIALSKRESLVGVFLDIASAYDNVLLPVLRQKMLQLSIPEKMVNFISNLFSSRAILISCQNSLLPPRLLWKGLPQGSVLSPLLYNLYTYDLELSVNSFCNVLQYADDLALYVSVRDLGDASARLNSAINYLHDWLGNHGLSLSVEKSSVVTFSRMRSIPDVIVSFDGKIFPVRNSVKFLGVVLDSRMTGVQHINHIIKKCEKNIHILRSLSGVWWGSHPYTQKLLYNALIRSHFDYGTHILEPCNKSALTSLDRIQSKCLRIIIGAMKSSPINALQVECAEPPLHLRRQYLSDRFIYKNFQLSNHPLISKLHTLSEHIYFNSYWNHKSHPCLFTSFVKFISLPCPVYQCRLNPLFLTPYNAILYRPDIVLNIGINKDDPGANAKFNSVVNSKWNGWHTMFTDASKIKADGCVGFAVWIPEYKIILNFKCPPQASVFTGEALAILEALMYIESHKLHNTVIFTDSRSCLQAILANQLRSKSKLPFVLKIKEILFRCHVSGIKITLAWIPGHSGIVGNEGADQCSKDATTIGSDIHYTTYAQDLTSLAKADLISRWNEAWNLSKRIKGKHYADVQDSLLVRPWFFKYRKANKRVTSTICRLRLGHACTPVHLAKIRVKDSSLCECGLDEGSAEHIFFNCPRRPSLYEVLPDIIPRPTNFKSLLSLVHTTFVNILCEYVHQNNIRL